MKKRLFITATNTDIGKTYTTLKLIKSFSDLGCSVGVFKPIETGVESTALDATTLLHEAKKYNNNLIHLKTSDICPIQLKLPAAPYVANNKRAISIEHIKEKLHHIEQLCDIVLIEGAGGLMVPINRDCFMIDLAKELDTFTLLVTHTSLGCINDTLLNIELLKRYDLKHEVIFNDRDDSFDIVSLPYFMDNFETVYRLSSDILPLSKALLDKIRQKERE